jgi:hypothetical protein
VKKINFLNSRTIEELRKNIEDVYSYIYNINSNVTSILQGIIEVNDFKIDEYVKKHYFKQIDEEETENISNEIMDEIKLSENLSKDSEEKMRLIVRKWVSFITFDDEENIISVKLSNGITYKLKYLKFNKICKLQSVRGFKLSYPIIRREKDRTLLDVRLYENVESEKYTKEWLMSYGIV